MTPEENKPEELGEMQQQQYDLSLSNFSWPIRSKRASSISLTGALAWFEPTTQLNWQRSLAAINVHVKS